VHANASANVLRRRCQQPRPRRQRRCQRRRLHPQHRAAPAGTRRSQGRARPAAPAQRWMGAPCFAQAAAVRTRARARRAALAAMRGALSAGAARLDSARAARSAPLVLRGERGRSAAAHRAAHASPAHRGDSRRRVAALPRRVSRANREQDSLRLPRSAATRHHRPRLCRRRRRPRHCRRQCRHRRQKCSHSHLRLPTGFCCALPGSSRRRSRCMGARGGSKRASTAQPGATRRRRVRARLARRAPSAGAAHPKPWPRRWGLPRGSTA
jgi:hypothetical protein